MRKLLHHAIITCFLLMAISANAQRVDSLLAIYNKAFPSEKTYIHFDKPVYFPGETIWFKAYFLSATELSNISKSFYLDWYDGSNKLIKHTIFPIAESVSFGQFDIPPALTADHLHLVAYTGWMLNFDSSFLFKKDIPVLLPNAGTNTATNNNTTTTVHFFPEGGDLVDGVNSIIAFKATDQYGYPVSVRGAIKNQKAELIDSFFSEHDGMGKFSIEPHSSETYTVLWKDANGVEGSAFLPSAKNTGVVLQLNNQKDKIAFTIHKPLNTTDRFKTVYIVATMNQHLLYRSKAVVEGFISKSGTIPTTDFPSGILQVTLFDADWAPVAERICFIDNEEYTFKPVINTSTKNLSAKGKNSIEISLPDTMSANLSVSITDESMGTDEDNIISHLLLTGELKGYVHQPGYYFSSVSDSSRYYRDLVMMTNGWRRIKWDEVIAGKITSPHYQMDTDYLQLKGKLTGDIAGKIKDDEAITLMAKAKDAGKQMLILPIKKDGSFEEHNLLFFDTLKIYYQLRAGSKLSEKAITEFSNNLLPAPKEPGFSLQYPHSLFKKYTVAEMYSEPYQATGLTLEGVTVTGIRKNRLDSLDDKYTSGIFNSSDAFRLDLRHDKSAVGKVDILAYIQAHVPGIRKGVRENRLNPRLPPEENLFWRGNVNEDISKVQIFVDELGVNYEYLKTMMMLDVAYIKVFRPPFFGGLLNAPGGAIAIYTQKGVDAEEVPSDMKIALLAGYNMIREFYSPDYSDSSLAIKRDRRTTLFWSPNVQTDLLNNKKELVFYNNDVSKKLKVVLEGVSKDGKLAHIEKIIE